MRIGLTGGAGTVDKIVRQATKAEADGFTSVWYASVVTGDSLMLSALGPRLLRVAGQVADGTVLWMAPPEAIETHVAPRVNDAAREAGRPAPRIVAGLPVAVHDDVTEAREAITASSTDGAPTHTHPSPQREERT